MIEYVLHNSNENKINGICMFDHAKCFDMIDHKLLLQKVRKYGLNGTELLWSTNYLNEQTQVATINGKISDTKHIDTLKVFHRDLYLVLCFLLYLLLISPHVYQMLSEKFVLMILR